MATSARLDADRCYGRTYTATDRHRSTPDFHRSRLNRGHLKLHPNFHHVDEVDGPRAAFACQHEAVELIIEEAVHGRSKCLAPLYNTTDCLCRGGAAVKNPIARPSLPASSVCHHTLGLNT